MRVYVAGLCAAPGGSGGSGLASDVTAGNLPRGMGGRLVLLDKPHASGAVFDVVAVVTAACGSQPALSLPTAALSLVSRSASLVASAYACAVVDGAPPLLLDGGSNDGRASMGVLAPELCWDTDVDEPADAACVSAPALLHGRLLPRPQEVSSVETGRNVLMVVDVGKRNATKSDGRGGSLSKSRMCCGRRLTLHVGCPPADRGRERRGVRAVLFPPRALSSSSCQSFIAPPPTPP